jgi:hypothetical protein
VNDVSFGYRHDPRRQKHSFVQHALGVLGHWAASLLWLHSRTQSSQILENPQYSMIRSLGQRLSAN